MSMTPRFSTNGQRLFGCTLIAMGSVAGGFGLAALTGVVEGVELGFFGIEIDSQGERILWLLGCLAVIAAGAFLIRDTKRRP